MATDDENIEAPAAAEGVARRSGIVRRFGVAIAGVVVIVVGIVLIPLPGPGWLIVFSGLAILATEFERPRRIRDNLRDRFRRFIGSKADS